MKHPDLSAISPAPIFPWNTWNQLLTGFKAARLQPVSNWLQVFQGKIGAGQMADKSGVETYALSLSELHFLCRIGSYIDNPEKASATDAAYEHGANYLPALPK